jgi:hypothetical protein
MPADDRGKQATVFKTIGHRQRHSLLTGPADPSTSPR